MCCEDYELGDVKDRPLNLKCYACDGHVDSKGQSLESSCAWSPIDCDACGWQPCDGSC